MAVKDIAGKMPIATRGHLNVNAIGVSMAIHTVLAILVGLNEICKSEKGISFCFKIAKKSRFCLY